MGNVDYESLFEAIQNGDPISIALLAVIGLIALVSLFSCGVSVYLAVSYVRYNRKKNSIGMSGEKVARKILDDNGLEHIKVKANGSLMFGNSYSHYFKKVRLRRRTWKKDSVSSLAMAAQKSSLAVLDKEGDPDMRRRIRLVPIITFGPFAFIPLLIIGIVLDILITGTVGTIAIICTALGFLFYLYSFILCVTVLKTEKKAQERAVLIVKDSGMANAEEIQDMKALFRLYNIEYINDMILALLELIYYILRIILAAKGSSGSSSKK